MRLSYRWELVIWLSSAYFLNQADRQILNVVLPLVKSDLGLSDVEAGLVAAVLAVALAVTIPIAGYVGDVFSRKKIITFSLLGWSLSTLLTGFAPGLLYLILVRSLATGVGEGLYAPSAFALIGEYHVEQRAQAMALHQTALYVGVVLSGLVAGYLGDHFGWRSAFWAFGFAGIILAAGLQLRLRESSPASRGVLNRPPAGLVLRAIVNKPTAVLLACGLACEVFVNIGYLTWMPTYLHERFQLHLANAGFSSMAWHFLPALVGVLAGGRLSDRFAQRRPRFRLEMQAAALLAASPFLLLLGAIGDLKTLYFDLAAFGFFRGFYDSNIYASLYEVIEPRFHASATGAMTAFAFVLGSLAPVVLGAQKQTYGLSVGLSGLGVVFFVAAALLCGAVFVCFERDSGRSKRELKCSS